MSNAQIFNVWYAPAPANTIGAGTAGVLGTASGHGRSLIIVTDTFQNATSLARSNLRPGEVIQSISSSTDPVVVDTAAIGQTS
jgi:hypothetical protein